MTKKKPNVNSLFIWTLNLTTMLQSIANPMDWAESQTEICVLQILFQICHDKSLNILLLLLYFSAYQTTVGNNLIKGKRTEKVIASDLYLLPNAKHLLLSRESTNVSKIWLQRAEILGWKHYLNLVRIRKATGTNSLKSLHQTRAHTLHTII